MALVYLAGPLLLSPETWVPMVCVCRRARQLPGSWFCGLWVYQMRILLEPDDMCSRTSLTDGNRSRFKRDSMQSHARCIHDPGKQGHTYQLHKAPALVRPQHTAHFINISPVGTRSATDLTTWPDVGVEPVFPFPAEESASNLTPDQNTSSPPCATLLALPSSPTSTHSIPSPSTPQHKGSTFQCGSCGCSCRYHDVSSVSFCV